MNIRVAVSAFVLLISSLGSAYGSTYEMDVDIGLGYSGLYQSPTTTLSAGSTFSGAKYSFYNAGLPVEVTSNSSISLTLSNFGLDPADGSGNFETDVSIALLDASGATVYSSTQTGLEIAVVTQTLGVAPGNVQFSSVVFSLSPAFAGVASYPYNGNSSPASIQLKLASVTDVAQVPISAVPLPATFPLLLSLLGCVGLVAARKRRT